VCALGAGALPPKVYYVQGWKLLEAVVHIFFAVTCFRNEKIERAKGTWKGIGHLFQELVKAGLKLNFGVRSYIKIFY